MYDPRGIFKEFTFKARPEVCTGTPDSIESSGRKTAREMKPFSCGQPLRLTPEPVPPGTPPGWRAFRFSHPNRITIGTVCGVVYEPETGNTVFVMNDSPVDLESGPACFTTRYDGSEEKESHILVPPNGFVSPELIATPDNEKHGQVESETTVE